MGEVVERIVVSLITVVKLGQEVIEVGLYNVIFIEVFKFLEDSHNQWLKKLLVYREQVQIDALSVDIWQLLCN